MRILVTSVVRRSGLDEPSGFVSLADLEQGTLIGSCPVPAPDFVAYDHNPRGGLRGAKGIAVSDDRVFIANASHIRVYDYDWNMVGKITHPSCASIHDIVLRNDHLWVTSSRNDLVLEFDLSGRILSYFNYRDYPDIVQTLGLKPSRLIKMDRDDVFNGTCDYRDPRTHSLESADTGHLNSVAFLANGDMLVSLGRLTPARMSKLFALKGYLQYLGIYPWIVKANRLIVKVLKLKRHRNTELAIVLSTARSAILRVTAGGQCSVCAFFNGTTVPNHSLMVMPDNTVFYDDTNNGELLQFNPDSGAVEKRMFVADDFLRGSEMLSESEIVVGSQSTVYAVNRFTGAVREIVTLSRDPRVSIYDIKVLPDGVANLPGELPE